ncbi:B-box zinc finger family protein [Trichomonas vaginalis G3]|uniref:Oxidation resistance protein 1 n=1 Tax=Trichomonas vaginalis (strain ATCC PRA-98 / G3) TaxID=412133 RepID=A2DLK6_TRIV3|nr:zinc ion binding [Trichomonas vaginalis G3]EAY18639.1 B-box zinc finger family protein [Trichomonas vaginalis G3]KAI5522524.1 zinc ion binding [Trichomonas vaginalis G3]|eukprot:XP_001579625.1 B-box zinc finger family protein [Trichomonas vaginalis G3]
MTQNLVPLAPHTEDYNYIEYELQLQLNAPKLRISDCYVLKNPHVEASYINYFKTLTPQNVVDVFVPLTSIDQTISDIAAKGIIVNPQTGFRFKVGTFDIDREQEMIEVIRITVALGNTLNFQSASSDLKNYEFAQDQPTSGVLRAGYHSLCVSDKSEYVVFNSAQIKTCEYIRFPGGASLEQLKEEGDICDQCGVAPATIWCENDNAKFCDKCDAEAHQSHIAARHRRMTLAEARALMEYCPFHKDTRVEYYCTECQMPVCIQCKMVGSHSKGQAASHPLIPIKQAYAEAIEAASKEDPIFARRRQEIAQKSEAADAKLEAIMQNERDVEQEIMRLANAAIERAKQLSSEKALIVRSVKTELQRKTKELDVLAKFIGVQKKYAGPLAFLSAFDRHSMAVANLQGTEDLPEDLTVEADLCVYGKLDVCPTTNKPTRNVRESISQLRENQLDVAPRAAPIARRESSPSDMQQTRRRSSASKQQISSAEKQKKVESEEDNNQEEEGYDEEETGNSLPPRKNFDSTASISSAFDSPKKHHDTPPPTSAPLPQRQQIVPMRPPVEPPSLVEMARKKEAKNKSRGIELTFQPFEESKILTIQSQSTALYLCFPFRNVPQTHLLFSTERDGRDIAKMHQLIDNIGITCLLIKKGDFIFGGFAAAKWNSDGKPFGNGSNSFLFSVSLDAYIPYRPRVADSCCLYATKDTLTFGKWDLILDDNFDTCSAVIENSYGVGFDRGSTEAQTFLAGEPNFRADIVEVWGFFTIDK